MGTVCIDLRGEQGNVYYLLSQAAGWYKSLGYDKDQQEAFLSGLKTNNKGYAGIILALLDTFPGVVYFENLDVIENNALYDRCLQLNQQTKEKHTMPIETVLSIPGKVNSKRVPEEMVQEK